MIQDREKEKYPIGWYHFDISSSIKKGKVYTYQYFDKPLVCFRNSKNIINVFDAHCPHLGAHLGVGGKILNDNLVCPFHGWRYNSAGQCVEIPYCKTIPKRAALKRYPSYESNSAVYIHFGEPVSTESPNFFYWYFNWLSNKKMTKIEYEEMINNDIFSHVKTIQPGFLLVEKQGAHLLIAMTPVNNEYVSVAFAFATNKKSNPISNYISKRKADKILKFLLKKKHL